MSRVQNNLPNYTGAPALTHGAAGGGLRPSLLLVLPTLNFALKSPPPTKSEALAFVVPAIPIVPFVVGGTIAHGLKILHGFKQHPLAQPLAQSLDRARLANDGLVQLMKKYQSHAPAATLSSLNSSAQPLLKALIAARSQLEKSLKSPQARNLPTELIRDLQQTLKQVNGWVTTGQTFMAKLARPTQASSTTEVDVWEKVRKPAGEQGDAIVRQAKELGLTPERVEALLERMTTAEVRALLNDTNLSLGGGGRGAGGGARVAAGAAPNDSPIERIIRTVEEVMQEAGTTDANLNATAWVLKWLVSPNLALTGAKPATYLGTQDGVNLLLEIVGAMSSGSYY